MADNLTADVRTLRRRPPRDLPGVQRATFDELALMTAAQVRVLSAPAAAHRIERLRNPGDTTEWDMDEVARYLGCKKNTVEKIRGRKVHRPDETVVDFPDPLPHRRPQRGSGRPSPLFPAWAVIAWASGTGQRADRDTLVPFPGGRPRPGRTPRTPGDSASRQQAQPRGVRQQIAA